MTTVVCRENRAIYCRTSLACLRQGRIVDFGWTAECSSSEPRRPQLPRRVLDEGVDADDRDGRFPLRREEARIVGFFGLSVPSDPGGAGLGCMSALLVMEGLGLAARQWSHVLRYRPGLSHHPHDAAVATDEHKRRYLPGLTSTRRLW